jgi:hypothetical protein
MKDRKNQSEKSKGSDQPKAESPTAFPNIEDEAAKSEPLKHRNPEPKKPGERLEDYLG